jgi:hypothetical protein
VRGIACDMVLFTAKSHFQRTCALTPPERAGVFLVSLLMKFLGMWFAKSRNSWASIIDRGVANPSASYLPENLESDVVFGCPGQVQNRSAVSESWRLLRSKI